MCDELHFKGNVATEAEVVNIPICSMKLQQDPHLLIYFHESLSLIQYKGKSVLTINSKKYRDKQCTKNC